MKTEGTKTHSNLMTALKKEADSYMRMKIYKNRAIEEGYRKIAKDFGKIAANEKKHIQVLKRYINEPYISENICGINYNKIRIKSTADNIGELALNEYSDFENMYKAFSKTAFDEGFPEIASIFNMIASVEKRHIVYMRNLLQMLNNEKYFSKDEISKWLCEDCGYIYNGYSAPDYCPLCYENQKVFSLYRNE